METLVIDMKNDHYTKDTDIENLLKYITGKGKRAKKCVCSKGKGLAKEYSKAAEQIITMQKFLGKNKKRRCYHMIISFPGSITDKNAVVIVAEAVAEKIFKEFQVYYGVHDDTDNLHIHFAINAVSYVHGKKWHTSKGEFEKFKKEILKIVQEIFEEYGYKNLRKVGL